MKQSPFISKYDYIAYYTKQKNMWFFSNQEVKAKILHQMHQAKNEQFLFDQEDDELDDNELEEVDNYSYYKEFLDQNSNIDQDDPKIAEGIILDQKSQEHIVKSYPEIKNILDCDAIFAHLKMQDRYQKTLSILSDNEDYILFQPVFITNNLITKPDALIKYKDQLIIIETKGTSSVKSRHILDLFYQYKVIAQNPNVINQFACHFKLCIVKYERLKVIDKVSFVITPYFVHQKYGLSYDIKKINEFLDEDQAIYYKANLKQGRYIKLDSQGQLVDDFLIDFEGLLWDDLLDQHYLENFTELIQELKTQPLLRSYLNTRTGLLPFLETISKIFEEFDDAISNLEKHKQELLEAQQKNITPITPNNFVPSTNDKGLFKDTDFFLDLRNLYQYENYELCKYSGYVFPHAAFGYGNINHKNDIREAFAKVKRLDRFDLYVQNKVIVNKSNVLALLQKLKPKKVYFDFESINTAIRVFDNTFAFTQIITQNSVIVYEPSVAYENLECNNMMCDPKKITVQWFKDIVDSLYHGDDYSYIVYNKSFEQTRLKEMISYINDREYTYKINCINRNMFDLADFFAVRSLEKINILIPDLHGFYSIKKVLPLVAKYYPDFFDLTKCYDYKTLEVQNGLECQIKTTKRVFDTLNDEQWIMFTHEAKKYCENDVRAMIAVELYIMQILRNEHIIN
ncbi:DUF2779 domain-containing protein [Ureaplasma sp. ES3154-GEN]|uniref:DUF2779 domain-containing protein n=1 Tax=Ureaplasma sp. ES3154-GEN TaxID=2984844 RepID=UPI0021E895B6|nr:DUF2779 domain-containing protein [Ureaplasma sp. ES3154-GEN]MCV3743352.1 DUF2779 domain-containing protein [Ureaplasma sp. ES3154-GEN]